VILLIYFGYYALLILVSVCCAWSAFVELRLEKGIAIAKELSSLIDDACASSGAVDQIQFSLPDNIRTLLFPT
jgi:hypothetical protein